MRIRTLRLPASSKRCSSPGKEGEPIDLFPIKGNLFLNAGCVYFCSSRMVFVGFSLQDDNFHRIADGVKKAFKGRGNSQKVPGTFSNDAVGPTNRAFGTNLTLISNPLSEELWKPNIEFQVRQWRRDGAEEKRSEEKRRQEKQKGKEEKKKTKAEEAEEGKKRQGTKKSRREQEKKKWKGIEEQNKKIINKTNDLHRSLF